MTNELNLDREAHDRMTTSTRRAAAQKTRANTIVRPTDHATPLELSNITIHYGGGKNGAEAVNVVDDFNMTLHAGEMHCVAGRSGSGKTSILTVGAGLTLPTSGRVFWEGDSLETMGDDEIADRRRALIGYVDQGGALIDGMSALENVLLPAVPDGEVEQRRDMAKDLLDLVGLGRRMRHRPAQLSGGERPARGDRPCADPWAPACSWWTNRPPAWTGPRPTASSASSRTPPRTASPCWSLHMTTNLSARAIPSPN